MLQSRQHDLLTRLLDLSGQKDLIQNGIDLVEVEHEIQFADVSEELVEHFDKEVDRLEVRELIVIGVDTYAEEQTGVAPVDDLGRRQILPDQRMIVMRRRGRGARCGPELDEVGLVFLVARRDEPVDLCGSESQCASRKGEEKKRQREKCACPYLALQFDLLFIGVRGVPFGESSFALSVLHEDE